MLRPTKKGKKGISQPDFSPWLRGECFETAFRQTNKMKLYLNS